MNLVPSGRIQGYHAVAHGLVGVVGIVITHGVHHMWSKHWAALLWFESCAKFPPVGYS